MTAVTTTRVCQTDIMRVMTTIGEALQRARLQPDLAQRKLAVKMGDRELQGTISRWERGQLTPSLEQVAAVEAALGFPRGYVLTLAGYVAETPTVEAAIAADE